MERFACKCCGKNETSADLVRLVNAINEEMFTATLVISSGYRCAKHNKSVGGKPDSAHLAGLAVDIVAMDSLFRFRLIEAALKAGALRIGIGKDFVHIDIDRQKPKRVIWLY